MTAIIDRIKGLSSSIGKGERVDEKHSSESQNDSKTNPTHTKAAENVRNIQLDAVV